MNPTGPGVDLSSQELFAQQPQVGQLGKLRQNFIGGHTAGTCFDSLSSLGFSSLLPPYKYCYKYSYKYCYNSCYKYTFKKFLSMSVICFIFLFQRITKASRIWKLKSLGSSCINAA